MTKLRDLTSVPTYTIPVWKYNICVVSKNKHLPKKESSQVGTALLYIQVQSGTRY